MENNFHKILLFISGMVLLFLCSAFVFLYQRINDNNQKIQQDTINLQTEIRRFDDITSLDRLFQKNATERAALENHFIKSSDIVPFLNMIEDLALKAGVSVQIDSINAIEDNSELRIGLKASGAFEAIYKFLTLLENSPYELDFISMDLHKSSPSAPDERIKSPSWEAFLKIQLLSFIP